MAAKRAAKHYRTWLAGGAAAAALTAVPALADKKDETRGPLFDPEALERGAAALREINKSPHAKQVGRAASRPESAWVDAGVAVCLNPCMHAARCC